MPASTRKSYRVLSVGVSYMDPTETTSEDGSKITLNERRDAHAGQEIELVASEADRLLALGAIVDADAPATYGEMKVADLKTEAERRGLDVQGTGADGRILREDYVVALEADDAQA